MRRIENSDTGRVRLLFGTAVVLIVVISQLFTTPFFNVLDDEAAALAGAGTPLLQFLKNFIAGTIALEHPPLPDVLLHFWMPIAGANVSLLRLPSIVVFAFGILVLALTAKRRFGNCAFYSTMLVGAIWPFGFHFGRIAGWYPICFLFVALLTSAYFRFLESPSWPRWLSVILIVFALVLSNYFGWAIYGLLVIDLLLTIAERTALRFAIAGTAMLLAAYAPLWPNFFDELFHHSNPGSLNFTSLLMNAVFNGYSLFISESVAPWYWPLSIPAGAAILVVLLLTPLLISGQVRRMYFGFWLLFLAMAGMNIINTKRLLFISCWLLIPIGCASVSRRYPRLRVIFATSLGAIAIIGWSGIIMRNHYSTPHFIEPWAKVARDAARWYAAGETIVANNGTFLFYLNAELSRTGNLNGRKDGVSSDPKVISILDGPWPASGTAGKTILVRGTNVAGRRRTYEAEDWLKTYCKQESTTPIYRDPEYELKKAFFPAGVDGPYRILTETFDCPDLPQMRNLN